MLSLEGIAKAFGATQALADVSLTLERGSIHGLLGENGAGKTTVMRILFGLERPDRGVIRLAGTPVRITSARLARALGIGMVHQHFALVSNLSVAENLVLALGSGLAGGRQAALQTRIARLGAELGWPIDLNARVSDLAVGQQQRIEILKALLGGGQVLILDEPTAPLTPLEAADLFRVVKVLAAKGTTVVFISHKLAEVEAVCDRLTILRRGRVVMSGPLAGMTRGRITELMIGAAVVAPVRGSPRPPGPVRLALEQVSVADRQGRERVHQVALQVHGGEIVGIAGVDGNGQTELVRAILGQTSASGTIAIAGVAPTAAPGATLQQLGVIPEDRQQDGLALALSLTENLLLKARRQAPFSTRGWRHRSRWQAHARRLIGDYDIRASGPQQNAATLSGGNQQKVVIARELSPQPQLVVAVNPTRGLDLGATASVMQRLLEARARGAAVLVVHNDLDELMQLADRILVMSSGRLTDSGWPSCTRDHIGALMLGELPQAAASGPAAGAGAPGQGA